MAMDVQGSRRHQDAGVKVKFIETQFISSDAASFKAVVQRLTGKSPAALSRPAQAALAPQPQRPRPCRPNFAGAGQQQHQAAGWPEQHQAGAYLVAPAPKQEPLAAVAPSLEEMHELCDFADLFYTTTTAAAGARRDIAGSAFPY
ncbi:hypothetical protein PAHAL_4G127200 [Panicum hallii]|uniref:VQ domain-containing protein n=1 Tax=Panicum hallii TaxID=206008 RepID=A0A2S3HIX6_9POAL|nr:uncharacterized protein LOC112890190 [Panicum hallii]PAN23873.1 hypothetical protein PAHAL_4G127200 [Panicum hallii]